MRPAWLEVNLDSLAHNFALLRSKAPASQLVGIVKANAYGHGAVPVGRELLRLGAWGLAVATASEGRELRRGGIQGRVLLMGSLHPDQAREVLEADLIASLSTLEGAQALDAAARASGKIAEVHLEFDTGMGRVGFQWDEAARVKEALEQFPNLKVTGLYSHFADAEENLEFTRMQLANFRQVREVWGPGYFCHLSNSAGVFNYPEASFRRESRVASFRGDSRVAAFDAIRPGIALYGLLPDLGLKPIARLLAKPTLVKQLPPGRKIGYGGLYTTQGHEWIATLPVGYADGMPRLLYNRATVRLPRLSQGGLVCLVVGRISMDQITVRIPGPVDLDTVFEVVTADFDPGSSLWGWAEMTGTVSYEPAVRLAVRLPRVYVRGGVEVARIEP